MTEPTFGMKQNSTKESLVEKVGDIRMDRIWLPQLNSNEGAALSIFYFGSFSQMLRRMRYVENDFSFVFLLLRRNSAEDSPRAIG